MKFQSANCVGLRKGAGWMINHKGKPYPQISECDSERFLPIWFATKDNLDINSKYTDLGFPDSKYDFKPVFFPRDGLRPFWNLG